jgi:nucleotide-binding universal stress UspA family protein
MKRTDIRTILVPIDFSKLSRSAIETASDLARRSGAVVHLVHVHEFNYPPGFMAPLPMPVVTFRDEEVTRRSRHLRMLAKQYGLSSANCHYVDGSPTYREICQVANEISADLIVMPTHGYKGMSHFFAGSTAERIVQHSPCPVLVARDSGRTPGRTLSKSTVRSIDTILVPVDFSQTSFQALEYAIDFAELVAARLIVVHAVEMGAIFTADSYGIYDASVLQEAARKDAETQIQRFVKLAKFGRVPFETAITVERAVPEICALAEQHDVDLIIMATHGRTGFKHLLIGSVAERVVRSANRSVLVVPSHPEMRVANLKGSDAMGRPTPLRSQTEQSGRKVDGLPVGKNRRPIAHPSPERRKTNKFRESHLAKSRE